MEGMGVMMKSIISLAILVAAALFASACHQPQSRADTTGKSVVVAEKPFVAGGTIAMQLDGGGYEVRPAADNRIRVTLSGDTGKTEVEITADLTHANVNVKDTPHSNFHATIEVPKSADLVIRLSGGDLVIEEIAGNKDVESNGGDIKIAVGDPNDYSGVDASVKAGNIDAGVFGGSKSGLFPHFTWSGPGKYSLRANLGAGNLVLRSK